MPVNKGGHMATATKTSKKEAPVKEEVKEEVASDAKTEEGKALDELDEQIAVFEPVATSVERKLIHPDTKEEKVYVQHEMGYMTKLKFFRLLSGTIRLASSESQGGIGEFISETFGDVSNLIAQGFSKEEAESLASNQFISTILKLVELVPEFMEESYVLMLGVRPTDHDWAIEALDSLDDEEGIDILDTFVAQNGKAIRRFFDRHLRRVAARASKELQLGDTEQE